MNGTSYSFLTVLERYVGITGDALWDILLYLLIGVGVFFTMFLGFVQIRCFLYGFKKLLKPAEKDAKSVSTFASFATSLGNKVGTGNIVGIAIAIANGGPGAIFWMWVLALLGMATAFAESTLGQLYKEPSKEGRFIGGPAYYITRALNLRWLAAVFSCALIFSLGLIFNAVQANSIAITLVEVGFTNTLLIGIILATIVAIMLVGGIHAIGRVTTYLVPSMAFLYIVLALVVVFRNFDKLPAVLELILSNAFGFESFLGGVAGYTFKTAITVGAQRGLFSNEAGMGTAPNISSVTQEKHPANQGFVQMTAVFVDTIICTTTALIILLSNSYEDPNIVFQGAVLVQHSLASHFGVYGQYFFTVVIFLFAFTSVLGNYAFAEDNVTFLAKNRFAVYIFRIAVLLMIVFGSIITVPFASKLTNIATALMTFINLIMLLILAKQIKLLFTDYMTQRKQGIEEPVFSKKKYPQLTKIHPSVWE